MPLDESTRQKIESFIGSHDVALFMKGVRGAPQCGFSATVTRLLDTLIPEYGTLDVLSNPDIREGVKEYSSWPTVPQLYVKGEFVGGCDIVQEMFTSGELHRTLGVEVATDTVPELQITEKAAERLQQAITQQGGPGQLLHLSIDARFQANLYLAPEAPGELSVEVAGIQLCMDPVTASRANGITVDVVESPQGTGFRIDIPGAPTVQSLSVEDLKRRLDAGDRLELLDVRTPEERATASIPGSVLLTEQEARRLESLPRDTPLVFHCHHGGRSQQAAEHFAALGFTEVYNVVGGIDAWSQRVDPSVPRY